ncbi:uncharacterized protein LOC133340930 isoform X1 [Lethenteron reissneri]|uniref:uncharacterized protein LOC133340930 isoform X1 n=1 Tax=Lethenteron reissneri TaxID=7753 RepID=UPI002AB60AEB|nr:uncharacterized protein LOC133340930 isoform X1 [Lethenteron reissneri]
MAELRGDHGTESPTGHTEDEPSPVSSSAPAMETEAPPTPPKKKSKRMQKYRDVWEEEYPWLGKVHGDCFRARCKICRKDISVCHGGAYDLKQHAAGEMHIRNMQRSERKVARPKLAKVAVDKSLEADKVTAAELANVYHTVRHNLSYNSMGCGIKFGDLCTSKKISCGRTKAESLVKDVLAPKAVSHILNALCREGQHPFPFAIQTDAASKGNRKSFPIAVQFFTPQHGMVNRMIDFIENPDTSTASVKNSITTSLGNLGLSVDLVSAFSADMTNFNSAVHHSLFTDLHRNHEHLLQVNCHAHIVHNAIRHAMDELSVDIENVIYKVCGFFAVCATRSESLKDFFDFLDTQWREILRNSTNKWVCLNPAISKTLQNWPAIKSELNGIGEECPKQIRKVLHPPTNGDAVEADDRQDSVEVYLLFCNNTLGVFEDVVKKLERCDVTILEIYQLMTSLKGKLNQRMEDELYGYITKRKLAGLPPLEAVRARSEFKAFLNCAVAHLQKWFWFSEENWLSSLQPLALHGAYELSFADLGEVARRLSLIERLQLDMDALFLEFTAFKAVLDELQKTKEWKLKSTSSKWQSIFQTAGADALPNLLSLLSFLLSVPATTGYVERILPLIHSKWNDIRNRCSIELIKSELLVTLNFDMGCADFHAMILKDKAFLTVAKSDQKYSFKRAKPSQC